MYHKVLSYTPLSSQVINPNYFLLKLEDKIKTFVNIVSRWFQETSSSHSSQLKTSSSSFQTSRSNFKVTSIHPFTTIQLRTRSDSDSVVLREWTFTSPTFSFLPQKGDIPLTSCPSGDAFLICQNTSGDLLKLPISRANLISSFTRLTHSCN